MIKRSSEKIIYERIDQSDERRCKSFAKNGKTFCQSTNGLIFIEESPSAGHVYEER